MVEALLDLAQIRDARAFGVPQPPEVKQRPSVAVVAVVGAPAAVGIQPRRVVAAVALRAARVAEE